MQPHEQGKTTVEIVEDCLKKDVREAGGGETLRKGVDGSNTK